MTQLDIVMIILALGTFALGVIVFLIELRK